MCVYDCVLFWCGIGSFNQWMKERRKEGISVVDLLYVWSNVVNFGTHFVSNYFAGGGPCVGSQDHAILHTQAHTHLSARRTGFTSNKDSFRYCIIKMSSCLNSFPLFTLNTNPAIVVPVFTGLGVLLFSSPRALSNKTFLNDKCSVIQNFFTF